MKITNIPKTTKQSAVGVIVRGSRLEKTGYQMGRVFMICKNCDCQEKAINLVATFGCKCECHKGIKE